MRMETVGLAFSGGGIRSATFNLGFLQGIASLHLLKRFDYLSTVSGGGYIGAWFAAWVRREGGPPGDPKRPSPKAIEEASILKIAKQRAKKVTKPRKPSAQIVERLINEAGEDIRNAVRTKLLNEYQAALAANNARPVGQRGADPIKPNENDVNAIAGPRIVEIANKIRKHSRSHYLDYRLKRIRNKLETKIEKDYKKRAPVQAGADIAGVGKRRAPAPHEPRRARESEASVGVPARNLQRPRELCVIAVVAQACG